MHVSAHASFRTFAVAGFIFQFPAISTVRVRGGVTSAAGEPAGCFTGVLCFLQRKKTSQLACCLEQPVNIPVGAA